MVPRRALEDGKTTPLRFTLAHDWEDSVHKQGLAFIYGTGETPCVTLAAIETRKPLHADKAWKLMVAVPSHNKTIRPGWVFVAELNGKRHCNYRLKNCMRELMRPYQIALGLEHPQDWDLRNLKQ